MGWRSFCRISMFWVVMSIFNIVVSLILIFGYSWWSRRLCVVSWFGWWMMIRVFLFWIILFIFKRGLLSRLLVGRFWVFCLIFIIMRWMFFCWLMGIFYWRLIGWFSLLRLFVMFWLLWKFLRLLMFLISCFFVFFVCSLKFRRILVFWLWGKIERRLWKFWLLLFWIWWSCIVIYLM